MNAYRSDRNDEGTPANDDDKDKPSATKSINTIDFSIPEFSLYALQAGVFSDTENAQKYADELINKGGAGYVVEFDEGFRVLIAGYLNEDDAKNVKERLLEEQNIHKSRYSLIHRPQTGSHLFHAVVCPYSFYFLPHPHQVQAPEGNL